MADLFLYSFETDFIQNLHKSGAKKQSRSFNLTYRYIDDVLSLNNSKFSDYIDSIYPDELEIKDTTDASNFSNYLDLCLEVDENHRLSTKIYDKRDDFNFSVVNFPFLCGNIPTSPAYGVFVSQLIRFARANSSYSDFKFRCCRLIQRLLRQGYALARLQSTFGKFYNRHNYLITKYDFSESCMSQDLFHDCVA